MTSSSTSLLGSDLEVPCLCETRTSALCWKEEEDLLFSIKFNEPVLICTLLWHSISCKRATGESRLWQGLNKPFLSPWFSKSLKIRPFTQEGSSEHGHIKVTTAPELYVLHFLPAELSEPHFPQEGEHKLTPVSPQV